MSPNVRMRWAGHRLNVAIVGPDPAMAIGAFQTLEHGADQMVRHDLSRMARSG